MRFGLSFLISHGRLSVILGSRVFYVEKSYKHLMGLVGYQMGEKKLNVLVHLGRNVTYLYSELD